MANLTTQQLAELLVGIARAQQAIIDAVESQRPGFKMTHFAPTLQTASRAREFNRQPTLGDFPARVLTECQRRGGPDIAQVQKDLESLLAQQPAAAAAGDESLDLTKS